MEGAAQPRPELCLFGIEPELGSEHGARYVDRPSDEDVNELFNEATVFVQTSTHEGFCLPPLEAMATGGAVVCTDAHGNRDFCVDGENCLMPEPTIAAVSGGDRPPARRPRAARAPRRGRPRHGRRTTPGSAASTSSRRSWRASLHRWSTPSDETPERADV